jgi:hypothetical protein
MLRTFVMEKHTKPILICSLCLRREYITHLPLYLSRSSHVGTAVKSKLFSTSSVKRLSMETQNKKNIVFSMSEARRLLTLAKPEKWKLFGKIFQKVNVYGVLV